ncbi:MAG: phage integrase SAM-like domain-containing protein [Chthoniobacteraceae bacterium]|nr:phage integrase SAM-like domain-containing protein [Chthoniobacteraceae bacterium]
MSAAWKHPKSPYWTAIYKDENGKWRRVPTKEKLKSKALLRAQDLEDLGAQLRDLRLSEQAFLKECDRMRRRRFGDRDQRTVREFFTTWLASQTLLNTEGTSARYGRTAKHFLDFLAARADGPLAAITPADCQGHLDGLLARKIAPATVLIELSTIRSIFKDAERQRLLDFNPTLAIKLPKHVRHTKRRIFTPEQVSMIIRRAAEENSEWETATLFGYYFGPRLGDAVATDWSMIDLVNGTVRYRPHKTGREQLVTLHPVLREHLIDIAGDAVGPICPGLAKIPIGGCNGLSRQFIGLMRRAGISSEPEGSGGKQKLSTLSFHSLRKTFNSEMHKAGVTQEMRKKIIGHKNDATNDIYTTTELSQIREAVDRVSHVVLPNKRQMMLGLQSDKK